MLTQQVWLRPLPPRAARLEQLLGRCLPTGKPSKLIINIQSAYTILLALECGGIAPKGNFREKELNVDFIRLLFYML